MLPARQHWPHIIQVESQHAARVERIACTSPGQSGSCVARDRTHAAHVNIFLSQVAHSTGLQHYIFSTPLTYKGGRAGTKFAQESAIRGNLLHGEQWHSLNTQAITASKSCKPSANACNAHKSGQLQHKGSRHSRSPLHARKCTSHDQEREPSHVLTQCTKRLSRLRSPSELASQQ